MNALRANIFWGNMDRNELSPPMINIENIAKKMDEVVAALWAVDDHLLTISCISTQYFGTQISHDICLNLYV
jgi:hypothetical protein